MDDSWRMKMGMHPTKKETKQNPPRWRSTDDASRRRFPGNTYLSPEDFDDVFGGPPRTVKTRQFSGVAGREFLPRSSSSSSSTSFYEEIFWKPGRLDSAPAPAGDGRSLPAFKIPAGKCTPRGSDRFDGFFRGVFGWNEEEVKRSRSRSRSESKTSSASGLSSEDFGPLRSAGELGVKDVSLFCAKLRPINVPRKWTSSMPKEYPSQPGEPSDHPAYNFGHDYNDYYRGSHFGFYQRNHSPDTISVREDSYPRVKVSAEDSQLNDSSSSIVSSPCQGQEDIAVAKAATPDEMFQVQSAEHDADEEVMSSYIIEIKAGDNREGTAEAFGVDEAIAWAKEKFQSYCSSERLGADQISDGHCKGNVSTHEDEEPGRGITGEQKQQLDTEIELELLNEKIRLWSIGKEADIRLLLSTLHHILWSESGWLAVPLTNLIETSHVKRAYQKARLLLHPDKLQQRGATFAQNYVAQMAFPILQDAWAAFVSQDVYN